MKIYSNKKLKIAIQLFGHLRTYKECYKSLKKFILNKYDCDVFMHTWDTIDHCTQTWHNNTMQNPNMSILKIVDELKNIYNLKDIQIEKQIVKDMGNICAINKNISIFGIHSMFHSMISVNNLREKYEKNNNINYDFVITLRPDLLLNEDFNIDYYIERLSQDEINKCFFTYCFPMVGVWNDYKRIGATDIFFFGKPTIISNIFANINKIYDKFQPDLNINFGPEYYFLNLIEELNYKINFIKYSDNNVSIIKRQNLSERKKTKLIKLKISLKNTYFYIFPNSKYNYLNLKINFFNFFKFHLCIGSTHDK